ncbi:hypothetical protein DEH18_21950 [Streptomyces sp. NHF165]|uniref:SseB family protein n=1 Tax=Streptomyces sp. NHF165 TaxID=2175864 RepID=UPI00132EB3C7|nr:SseB family protein [Streptomyces sp. NHF165]QHF96072.1 hypothetical protein DEH18_21950 [Streptomyces sp. NHF165]
MSLRDLVAQEVAARMTAAEQLSRLRSVRLYFRRPKQPGFFVSETVEGPMVAVFTSWEGLALYAGACEWASTTADDLAVLLPEGVRALVDPLGPHPFVLDLALDEASARAAAAAFETAETRAQ